MKGKRTVATRIDEITSDISMDRIVDVTFGRNMILHAGSLFRDFDRG